MSPDKDDDITPDVSVEEKIDVQGTPGIVWEKFPSGNLSVAVDSGVQVVKRDVQYKDGTWQFKYSEPDGALAVFGVRIELFSLVIPC